MPLVLKSVEEEAADCRARCAGMKAGDLCLLVHHRGPLIERLYEAPEKRILCILNEKSAVEPPVWTALRLRLMGPLIEDACVVLADTEWRSARAKLDKADAELDKARTEWGNVHDKVCRARTEWAETCVKRGSGHAAAEKAKARAEFDKAYDELGKARTEFDKAAAEWGKAVAELSRIYAPHYARLFPDSPWNGETIFAGEFAL